MNYFFDIGANSGQAFDFLLSKNTVYDGWNVFLFEPSPRSFAALLEKAKVMSPRYNVTVLPFAVGGHHGTQKFYESVDSECDTLQPKSLNNELWNHHNKAAGYEIVVAVVSFSDFIAAHTKPDDRIVVKLDAEGAEYEILGDLLPFAELVKRISTFYIEWHWVAKDQVKERRQEKLITEQLRALGCKVSPWIH